MQLKPNIPVTEDEARCYGAGELLNMWPHAAHYSNTFRRKYCSCPRAIPDSALHQVAKHTAAAVQRCKGQTVH